MEAFKTTLLGQVARKIRPHPALLYNDEKSDYISDGEKARHSDGGRTVVELSWSVIFLPARYHIDKQGWTR